MKDLTKGSPLRVILRFALPLAAGNLFQMAYYLADTRIIGIYLGDDALTAVGATGTLSNLLVGFLNGLTNGFALLTAMRFGKKDYEEMRRVEGSTIVLGLLTALLLTVGSIGFLPAILTALQVPAEHMQMASAYIRIILLGLTMSMMYNVCASILRAIGDTITPLIFLVVSAALNIILDLYFILVCRWGVTGAAFATVLSQTFSFAACAVYMWARYRLLRFRPADCRLRWGMVKELLGSGLSMGLMNSLVNFGSVILQSGINGLGQVYIIAHTAARRITEVFMLPFSVFGMTMATYCSQNHGAGEYGRIYEGFRKTLLLTWGWCLGVLVCSYTVAPWLVQFVVATQIREAVETAALYLRMNTLLYFVCAVVCIGRNVLQGVGVHKTPVISSFLELFGKCAAVFLLVPRFGYWGVIWAEPISWVIMVIPLLISLLPRLRDYRKTTLSATR